MDKYNISSRFIKKEEDVEEEEAIPRNSIGLRLSIVAQEQESL